MCVYIYIYIYIYYARVHTHARTHAQFTAYSLQCNIAVGVFSVSCELNICTQRHYFIRQVTPLFIQSPSHDIRQRSFLSSFQFFPSYFISFRCIAGFNFIQYIWTSCWKYIPSAHRRPSNCGSSKKPTGSDCRQLPNKIISLCNVDQLYRRKVRDLALWATVCMLMSSWRLR